MPLPYVSVAGYAQYFVLQTIAECGVGLGRLTASRMLVSLTRQAGGGGLLPVTPLPESPHPIMCLYPPPETIMQVARCRNPFTLIELLVVVAIIAVLAAMLLPALNKARAKAREATCTSQVSQIMKMVTFYADENDDFLPPARCDKTSWNNLWFTWLPNLLATYQFGNNYEAARRAINAGTTIARCPKQPVGNDLYDAAYLTDVNTTWKGQTWYSYGLAYVKLSPSNGVESLKLTRVVHPAHTVFTADSTLGPVGGVYTGYFHMLNNGWNWAYPDLRHSQFTSISGLLDGHSEPLNQQDLFGNTYFRNYIE